MGVNGIYGLSGSGLDIESLVKMGMSNQNKQYDKMEQKEIANTWLKEAYNDVYNDLTTYKYGTLSDYKMQSNLNAMQATSNNSSVVTATANGAAASMNHTVTVDSVASNAYLMTTQKKDAQGQVIENYGVTRANQDAQSSNKLADVIFGNYSVASYTQDGNNFNFTYKVNGQEVNGSDVAISLRLKDTAGSDKEYTLTYTYDELFTGFKSGEYTGYTGDQSSLFSGGKSLNDFASAIAKTGANIQGGYDTANDSFSLYNKTSGKENIIGITADNGNTATLLNNLNLGSYDVANNKLGDRIDFTADNTMKTVMESSGITNSALSVSLKDVLGLKATSTKNGDNYDIAVTQYDKNGKVVGELGNFTVDGNGNSVPESADTTIFSMNLSNGTSNATISFTLGELFNLSDIGKKNNLGATAGLSDFADKINKTGLGITSNYDSVTDSFALTNPNGSANLTATGANQTVATQLIDSLNLTPSTSLHVVGTTTNTDNLADVFGVSGLIKYMSSNKYTMNLSNGTSNIGSQTGNRDYFAKGTGKDNQLFSFEISDGTDKTATVDVSYGDVVDYSAFTNNGWDLRINDYEISSGAGWVATQKTSNDLSALAEKINKACKDKGLNIKANYVDGKLTIANPDGNVVINGVSDDPEHPDNNLNVYGGLNVKVVSDTSSMTYMSTSTKGITRVNEHSTEDSLADALGISAVKDGDTLTIKKSDGTKVNASDTAFTLQVGDSDRQAEFTFTYGDLFDTDGNSAADLSALAEKINAATKDENGNKIINVTAAVDADGKLTLTNDKGYATLTGVDTSGKELVSRMGLKESEETAAAKDHSWAGTNASVTIDGKTYDNATNKLTVAGVTYTFLDQTQAGQKATISVSQDTDKIVDYMKSFVDDYNKLLDSLNEKLSEKKYSDYKPLSKRQEDEMTEKQIEKWNEKAKSGLLYHNSEIQNLVSAMREAIYTKVDAVDSQYNTLASVGITSTNTKGHLTLDTDKLKKALADDPDCIYQLFASDQDSTYIAGSTNKNKITSAQQKQDYANTGVANRLYNVMTNHMSKISDIAGTSKSTDDQSYLGKLITDMQTKMKTFKTQMSAYENKLFKRYDAMEVALSKLNMQLGYISGSFS
ncbi:flagellar filament capping protein FliD [Anaerovibrio lipolyticus]|uniref:flagellar filament capping protein FliD n=1 Tax=Anaerovibrio lipolyticus TaxID=82374 RepID=UPI0004863513|nr:flagellar filament capping protein FliD [Anaerovibrio lipolyticus]